MGDLYEFDDVDGFGVGTVGMPGQRTFFFQVRVDGRRVTLKCEKQQVGALGQYLQKLLEDLPSPTDRPLERSLELVEPIEPVAFTIGSMGLAYDRDLDRFVVMLEEFVAPDPDTGEPDPDEAADAGRLRLHLSRGQALAFSERSEEVVAAGRPACVWCGLPMDPAGHACPRMN
jgi:uncharacterized repeat protein (TIGR03847 family)